MWKALLKAARHAKKAHAGQTRAHGAPYFEHPALVARLLWEKGHREPEMLMAAYLHDTVEDCGEKPAFLAAKFGCETARLVAAVSQGEKESDGAYYARMRAAGKAVMTLKLADREANGMDLRHLPAGHKLRKNHPRKLAEMKKAFA